MAKEETLDPENWEEMKALGRRMVDDMLTFQQNIRSRPMFKNRDKNVLDYFKQPAPEEPLGAQKTYEEFLDNFLENKGSFISHPCCWGGVTGQGTPMGALADMWMSGINGHVHNADLSTQVESQVLQWLKEMLGYPMEASGVLVSGGSMADLIGLTVGRNAKAGYNVNLDGTNQKLTFYGSTEMHSVIQRDLELIGVGSRNLRRIPVDERFMIDIPKLAEKVREDREAGFKPVCVVGNSGSVNVGAIDDLSALSKFCGEEGLWLHVDGAFGAWAAISPKYRYLVDGQERADSLAFDLHKWMYMPTGIGCTLVRDEDAHYRTFQSNADYIHHEDKQINDYTFELSRPLRALKAWMCIKDSGVGKYRRLIEMNIDQSRYLGKLVGESPRLELVAPVQLNVVCFRYVGGGLGGKALDQLNSKIFQEMINECMRGHAQFGFLPSVVDGKTVLRVCITNHRARARELVFFEN